MSKVQATRMAYQSRQKKGILAARAVKLLEQKQTVLLNEIRRSADLFLSESSNLAQISNRARYALSQAEAVLGEKTLGSFAISNKQSFPIDIRSENIMGVDIPDIQVERNTKEPIRNYGLTNTSLLVDEVAETASTEIHALIRLANRELRLRRLLDEYRRTSRRLNAIEQHLIPKLAQESTWIKMSLEERERGEYYRLKRAKKFIRKS